MTATRTGRSGPASLTVPSRASRSRREPRRCSRGRRRPSAPASIPGRRRRRPPGGRHGWRARERSHRPPRRRPQRPRSRATHRGTRPGTRAARREDPRVRGREGGPGPGRRAHVGWHGETYCAEVCGSVRRCLRGQHPAFLGAGWNPRLLVVWGRGWSLAGQTANRVPSTMGRRRAQPGGLEIALPKTKGAGMTRRRPVAFLATLGALALTVVALAGCGGGGSKASTAPASPKTAGGAPATVGVANVGLGKILVNSHGRTLYLFTKDSGTTSACSGACAVNWPPLRASGKPTLGSGAG